MKVLHDLIRNKSPKRLQKLILAAVVCFGAGGVMSADYPVNDLQQQEMTAAEALVAAETDAWNRGDAKAFAAHFAADGSFTNVLGMTYYGRQAFEERHAQILATIYKGSFLKQSIGKLRFIRPDVAVIDVNVELSGIAKLPPGIRIEADGIGRSKLQLVLVKEGGTWWITAYHNVSVMPLPPKP